MIVLQNNNAQLVANRNIKILLVSVGSPTHYALWNELSCETLAGDLRGFFGNEVEVSIRRINKEEDIPDILEYFKENPQDIIGLSIQPGSLTLLDLFIKGYNSIEFMDDDNPLIVFGNQIPTYFPNEMLKKMPEGVIVRGEGEESLRELVEFVKGNRNLKDIPNLVYKNNDKIIYTELETPNLKNLSFPPGTDTIHEILKHGGNAMVQASRGCPWGACAYCTRKSFRHGKKWEGFSVERVMENIMNLVNLGITEIEFCDDEFIGGRDPKQLQRIEDMADGLENIRKENDVNLTFRIFSRPDIIYKENDAEGNTKMRSLLLRLKGVGLVKVYLGIEAGCKSQMKRFMRGMTLKEIRCALKTLKEFNIDIDAGFIMFDPELTLEEMMKNIIFFRKENLIHYNQWPFRPLVLNEGSFIKEKLDKEGNIKGKDIDFIKYFYEFKDENVAKIAKILDEESRLSRSLFYALKTISKRYFDHCKKDEETILAQRYVEEAGSIYLDLMEKLCINIRTASDERIREIINNTRMHVNKLAYRVAGDIVMGNFKDMDGRLKNELKNYGTKIHLNDM
ncbi:MAG: hypothetical protein CVT95_12180 [Bacteroidetes bacterium HGW-Bacteroidetes-12]|nr:MAG: hypothetical protein CVT95_12180 [Bacteroidetes bacterium HGW-Bacteroidetes-12]